MARRARSSLFTCRACFFSLARSHARPKCPFTDILTFPLSCACRVRCSDAGDGDHGRRGRQGGDRRHRQVDRRHLDQLARAPWHLRLLWQRLGCGPCLSRAAPHRQERLRHAAQAARLHGRPRRAPHACKRDFRMARFGRAQGERRSHVPARRGRRGAPLPRGGQVEGQGALQDLEQTPLTASRKIDQRLWDCAGFSVSSFYVSSAVPGAPRRSKLAQLKPMGVGRTCFSHIDDEVLQQERAESIDC
eukprot:6192611-Pleurochrysis_carterae.AAC.1